MNYKVADLIRTFIQVVATSPYDTNLFRCLKLSTTQQKFTSICLSIMAGSRLVLLALVAFIYGANAQNPNTDIIFEIGNGISTLSVSGGLVTADVGVRSNRRLCFNGINSYYTDGDVIQRDDNFVAYRAPTGVVIDSLVCDCNVLAYSYTTTTPLFITSTIVVVIALDTGIRIERDLGTANIYEVGMDIAKLSGDSFLVIVAEEYLIIWNVQDLTGTPLLDTQLPMALSKAPGCVSTYLTTTEILIFVSFDGIAQYQVLTWNRNALSAVTIDVYTVTIDRTPGDPSRTEVASIYCVAVDAQDIYFFTSRGGGGTQISASAVSGLAQSVRITQADVFVSTDVPVLPAVYGLSVCGTGCRNCPNVVCPCDGLCGFCYQGITERICQCGNSLQSFCFYDAVDVAISCVAVVPRIDASCIVQNPLALRRSGPPIDIIGVTTLDATITVDRLAPTGRWRELSQRSPLFASRTDLFSSGYSFPVPGTGKGKRFGAYFADINPANGGVREQIPCVATENSGFLNQLYTVTVSQGESAQLVAMFMRSRLIRFQQALRWQRTSFDVNRTPSAPISINECSGQLACTIPAIRVVPGIYEVFRLGRALRSWHPIFYLFVRGCGPTTAGLDCSRPCLNCVHGICDDVTGLCNCYPGYTGELCDSACGPGVIGSGCSYSCNDVFSGNSDCSNLHICKPGKVGCRCYPGFAPPTCSIPCPTGTWGSNCERTCASNICNPKTGP